jgi:hypothetical protein
VFGEVTAGMDVVNKIKGVKTGNYGRMHQDVPTEDVVITKVTLPSDPCRLALTQLRPRPRFSICRPQLAPPRLSGPGQRVSARPALLSGGLWDELGPLCNDLALVSTIAIGLDRPGSDLDILCQHPDPAALPRHWHARLAGAKQGRAGLDRRAATPRARWPVLADRALPHPDPSRCVMAGATSA